jgi:hypothetical protein
LPAKAFERQRSSRKERQGKEERQRNGTRQRKYSVLTHSSPLCIDKSKMINDKQINFIISGHTTQLNINARNESLNKLANDLIKNPHDKINIANKCNTRGIINKSMMDYFIETLQLNPASHTLPHYDLLRTSNGFLGVVRGCKVFFYWDLLIENDEGICSFRNILSKRYSELV